MLGYTYSQAQVVLQDAGGEVSPHSYVLCAECADALQPPRGWILEDHRSQPVLFIETGTPVTVR